jgi:hypothetical protein
MTLHIVTDNGIHLLPPARQAEAKNGFVEAMALDLVAAAGAGLDITTDRDVCLYLILEAGYSAKAVGLYADDAMVSAQETVVAAAMGARS